jgi:hypothetical protein
MAGHPDALACNIERSSGHDGSRNAPEVPILRAAKLDGWDALRQAPQDPAFTRHFRLNPGESML